MQINRGQRAGFTLVEIMIVVAIIGMLAGVAIPSLVKSRKTAQRQACISNMRSMQGVKANWALDMKKGDNDTPPDGDIFGNGKYLDKKPECPAGGTYAVNPVSQNPTCTVPEHVLE
jgi:prepilin-type N-terminal cleavage/methylation domain-containing protein